MVGIVDDFVMPGIALLMILVANMTTLTMIYDDWDLYLSSDD